MLTQEHSRVIESKLISESVRRAIHKNTTNSNNNICERLHVGIVAIWPPSAAGLAQQWRAMEEIL